MAVYEVLKPPPNNYRRFGRFDSLSFDVTRGCLPTPKSRISFNRFCSCADSLLSGIARLASNIICQSKPTRRIALEITNRMNVRKSAWCCVVVVHCDDKQHDVRGGRMMGG